ncbi:MAG: serine/threonine-protein phosphatase [Flavobacteriales bacterium]|nr:serine/threonine-protein phosphatase [Flavobacteriales bacterium]
MDRSLRSKNVLMVLYGAVFALCTAFVLWSHHSTYRDLRQNALGSLGSISSTLAGQVDGDHVMRLLERYDAPGMLIKNTQDAWYYVMQQRLEEAHQRNALVRPILVLHYDSLDQELQVVATSERVPRMRERADIGEGQLLPAYHAGGRVDPEGLSEHAELLAFDSIRDRHGRVVAILLASLPLASVRSEAILRTWRNMGITGALFLLLGLFLFGTIGRWLGRHERIHAELQVQHAGVKESMRYVRKIQDAMIPASEVYAASFSQHFILHRPKDTVSGDFHWFHRISTEQCLVAAADCTGHGLPGAMLSGICCSLLNELVLSMPLDDPASILEKLDRRLIDNLHQQGKRLGAGDGMDVALCRIDKQRNELLFAGAQRPLYWVHDGELTIINGDRKPIGGSQYGTHRQFTCHRLAVKPGDRVYLFSDGYVDQLGGPEHKRFRTDRLNQLVMGNQHLDMNGQGEVLEQAFLEWKGETEQMDDICMLGLQV